MWHWRIRNRMPWKACGQRALSKRLKEGASLHLSGGDAPKIETAVLGYEVLEADKRLLTISRTTL